MYGFIESKSKRVGFYVVLHVHYIGTIVYGPLSARYIERILSQIYFHFVVI